MHIPESYKGREQTYLKHRVLEEYLTAWGHKLGSVARRWAVRLWYVDCFAGPWNQHAEDLADTSVSIGLKALNAAADTWRSKAFSIEVAAIFVEKDPAAYRRLEKLVADQKRIVTAHTYQGTFGDHVQAIERQLAGDAALLFVDPTGWKGAAMNYVAPLMRERYRDVVVNVMFNFIHRFKDDPRGFLRQQMRDFFGLEEGDIPPGLSEVELMKLYREQLKAKCSVTYAADLAVPHPTQDRTWFRLVIGGKHPTVLELFRDTESKVVGREAAAVREAAKRSKRETKSHQLELGMSPPVDHAYEGLHRRGLTDAAAQVLSVLEQRATTKFGDLWPMILEEHHISVRDVAQIVMELKRAKKLVIRGLAPRQRVPKDENVLARP